MTFDFYAYRFTFAAREAITFRQGAPANIVRGALGRTLRRIACAPDCEGFQGKAARGCQHRAHCAYARMFEPSGLGAGPSGLADWPRPFAIRASSLDGCTVAPGEAFSFDINLFDTQQPLVEFLTRAFQALDQEGLSRGRAELVAVEQLDREGRPAAGAPISIPLERPSYITRGLRVVFRTPTELKSEGQLAGRPEFGVLFARARDRISALRSLYGAGPLEGDFRSLGERANAVRMTDCQLQHVHRQRRSSRTGLSHRLGGFIGWAEYEGELSEFLPLLEAAQWTGVGRHCVWGNGELRIEPGNRL